MQKNTLIRLMLVLAMASTLSGCLVTAAAVGAGTGAAAVGSDPRDSKSVFSDQDISYNVENAIESNKTLSKQTNITATTYNGVVLLTGQALNQDAEQQAVQLAQGVKGVKMIYNEVTIGKPQSTSVSANDTWITTKIRTDLLLNQGWSANDFKVVTEGGVVYMMGMVTPAQAEIATQSASQVSGVKKVVKLFENKPVPAPAKTASSSTSANTSASTTATTQPTGA